MRNDRSRPLVWLLATAALVELVVLRTATRTLIHIPGTERFDTPISLLAEAGRLAYYIAAISLVASLVILGVGDLRSKDPRRMATGVSVVAFLVVAGAGRLEVIPWPLVGWSAMAAMVAAGALAWRGVRSVPVGFFLLGSIAAGSSVVAQAGEGGLAGGHVDVLVWIAEVSVLFAGLTAPLLLERLPAASAWIAGAVVAVVVAGSLTGGASTISILVLWNVGIPGWMPGLAYALAAGGLAVTIWSAAGRGEWPVLVGSLLLVAGGVGMISTYQTGLVIAGVLVLGRPREVSSTGSDAVIAEVSRVGAVPIGT